MHAFTPEPRKDLSFACPCRIRMEPDSDVGPWTQKFLILPPHTCDKRTGTARVMVACRIESSTKVKVTHTGRDLVLGAVHASEHALDSLAGLVVQADVPLREARGGLPPSERRALEDPQVRLAGG